MSIETVTKLKTLKLHGMAQSWSELVAQARHAEFDPERSMGQLIASDRAHRGVRRWARAARRASGRAM